MHLSMYICSMCGERGVHVGGLLEEETHIPLDAGAITSGSGFDPDYLLPGTPYIRHNVWNLAGPNCIRLSGVDCIVDLALWRFVGSVKIKFR